MGPEISQSMSCSVECEGQQTCEGFVWGLYAVFDKGSQIWWMSSFAAEVE